MAEQATTAPRELKFENNSTYIMKVDSVKHVTSSNKNTPGVEVTLVSAAGSTKGNRLFDTIWLTKGTKWKIDSFLNATGVAKLPQDSLALYETFNGKLIEIRAAIEEGRVDEKTGVKYDDRNRVGSFVGPVAGGNATPNKAGGSEEVPF